MNGKIFLTVARAAVFFVVVPFLVLPVKVADSGVFFDGEILRLHVIANSDSEKDTALKLRVRDEVLLAAKALGFKAENAAEAEKLLFENKDLLITAAKRAILSSGATYDVRADFGVYHFPLKSYGSVTLPEGNYNALKIVIGKGGGHNWWCVMYPPLCILNETAEFDKESLSSLSEKTKKEITGKPEIKVKFKIKEILKGRN